MSMIGKPAPKWSAPAYLNGEEATVSSKDMKGSWYVLYWYPLDFTFVCPTEIRGFQKLVEDFADDGVKLVGASTDSFFSHKAWFADKDIFAEDITHPIIADTSHKFTKAFKMLKKDAGIAFRGTVIVDDKGIIRSVATNDLSAGRSPDEVLRTVQALQSGGLCAADWSKGEEFVG